MSAHTPLPWKSENRITWSEVRCENKQSQAFDSVICGPLSIEDSEFIAHACNSHAILIEALLAAETAMRLQQVIERGRGDKTADGWNGLIEQARAALKLAGEA